MEAVGNSKSFQQTIDRIIYLASLASDRRSIDPLLEKLRAVTSRQRDDVALGPEKDDLLVLDQIEQQLKEHLVNGDPLRSFTPESLEQRLLENTKGDKQVSSKNRRDFILILAASFSTLFITFFLLSSNIPLLSRVALALPAYLTVITGGIAWFHMSALQNFRPELRQVFKYLTLGWTVMGIIQLHYAVILAFNLVRYPVFKYVGITALTSLWMVLIFIGLQKAAQLLQIKTRFASYKWVSGVALGLTLLAAFAPHPTAVAEEVYFRLAVASPMAAIAFGIASTVLGFKICRAVTAAYSKPLTIMAYYLGIVTINTALGISALFVVGTPSPAVIGAIVGTGTLPQILLLYTSYLFKKDTGK